MNPERDIEELLLDEGERWRQTVPVDQDLNVDVLRSRPSERHMRRSVLAVGSIAAILGATIIGQLGPGRLPSSAAGSPGTNPSDAPELAPKVTVVESGDHVTATGGLSSFRGELYLCPTQFIGLSGGLGCVGPEMVPVRGGASSTWEGLFGRVEGTWDGHAIQATSFAAQSAPVLQLRLPIPCQAPDGGWPGLGDPDELESASRALEQEIEQGPKKYVGWWPASTTDTAGNVVTSAIVVGTVDDPALTQAALSQIYPFNLCVVRVAHSLSELEAVRDELTKIHQDWRLEVEPSLDRVTVWATALQPQGLAALTDLGDKVDVRVTLERMP